MSTAQQHQRQDRSALESELRQAGADIRGNAVRCPFHDDRHASGSIYQGEDGVWRFRCNASSCGVSGDVFDIRARATGRSLEDVLREASPEVPKQTQRPSERVFRDLGDLRLAVARGGQIEAEYAYEDPDTGRIDLLVVRLKTPEGKAFRQCHLVPGGWIMRAPAKPWPLYRRAEIRKARGVVVCEGEKSADALNAIGIVATTSPGGAGKGEYTDWSALAGKRVWLWPDNDDPGRAHIKQVASILEKLDPAPTIHVINPSDLDLETKEDAHDFIEQCRVAGLDPKQAVVDIVGKARSCSVSSGLRDRIEDTASGKWSDVPWPWPKLTALSRALLPQTVTILCGSPGAAKSFFVLRALLAWFEAGVSVAYLALEEDRTYHLDRVLALREGNIELLNPDSVRMNPQAKRDAYERQREYLDRLGRRIWDAPVEAMTLDQIADWIRDRARDGVRVLVVDPLTAAAASDRPWVGDTRFVNNVKAVVRSHDASLLLVTHPRKGSKFVGLDDLAGGAAYQRLAQCVLWLERHKQPKNAIILSECGRSECEINNSLHICKARNASGHGTSLGFAITWATLGFAEKGIIVKGAKS